MGGDAQPCLKLCPITSPDRPGLPNFSRATLKNMGWPGYEARLHNQNVVTRMFIKGRGIYASATTSDKTEIQAHVIVLW